MSRAPTPDQLRAAERVDPLSSIGTRTSVEERYARGRAIRKDLPPEAHGGWTAPQCGRYPVTPGLIGREFELGDQSQTRFALMSSREHSVNWLRGTGTGLVSTKFELAEPVRARACQPGARGDGPAPRRRACSRLRTRSPVRTSVATFTLAE